MLRAGAPGVRRVRRLPQTEASSRRPAGANRIAASGRRLRHRRTTASRPVAAEIAPRLPAGGRAATTGTARRRVQATHVDPVPATVPVTVPVTTGAVEVRVRS